MDPPELPDKGFTKAERAFLDDLIEFGKTLRVIDGDNIDSDELPGAGTLINAECGE